MASATVVPPPPPHGPDGRWFQIVRDLLNYAYASTTTTTMRPPNPVIGQTTFDTSLGIPIWCKSLNPVVWVNASGMAV